MLSVVMMPQELVPVNMVTPTILKSPEMLL